jgi:DNA-binding NarL/FixJ family response regulator
MDNLKAITSQQLTEKELIFFLLIESGMSRRELAKRLGLSNEGVGLIYDLAASKMKRQAEAGFFQTDL